MKTSDALKLALQGVKKYVDDSIADASINGEAGFSGDYNDLTNKPIIPTVTNDLTNELKTNYDEAYIHSQAVHAPSDAQKNSDITQEEIEAKLTGRIYTHNHSRMSFDDNTHDGLTQPIDYDRGVFFNFSRQQENRFNGLEYAAVQTIKPFKAGDAGHQFVYPYNDDTARNKIFYRSKLLKDSGWGEWAEIYTSLNKPTASDIGAATEKYVDDQIAENRFSGNYNDLTNKPAIPSIQGLASESYVNNAVTQLNDNLQGQIDDLFQNVSNGKELIASAITDKGVDASKDETFQSLSEKINQIPVGPPGSNIIGYINEENDIYVSLTELESGTYTLKFEDYYGLLDDFDDIGNVEVE